jgi:hypothetical protein
MFEHTAFLADRHFLFDRQLDHAHAKDVHELTVGRVEDCSELACMRAQNCKGQLEHNDMPTLVLFAPTSGRLIGNRECSQASA